jgi:hypothetical protein
MEHQDHWIFYRTVIDIPRREYGSEIHELGAVFYPVGKLLVLAVVPANHFIIIPQGSISHGLSLSEMLSLRKKTGCKEDGENPRNEPLRHRHDVRLKAVKPLNQDKYTL